MSRRHRAEKRQTVADARYNSVLVAHLVNVIMKGGKKNLAQRIVYGAFEKVSEKLEKGDPVDLLLGALENARPRLEVKSRRVGGATYQVPMEVPAERQLALAMRWIVGFASKRKSVPMHKALASELKEAASNQGNAIKKRDDVHRMAEQPTRFGRRAAPTSCGSRRPALRACFCSPRSTAT